MKHKRKKINYFYLSMLLSVFMLLFSCQRERTSPEANVDSTVRIKPIKTKSTKVSDPTVNVYIDNSGSMKGFVDGVSEFRDLLHQYITNDIKGSGIASKVNTYFINNTMIPCEIPSSLTPKNLNNPNTDIAKLLRLILSNTGKDTISIFISDCIFSPNKANSALYLGEQQILIQNEFTAYKNKFRDVAVVVYQLEAQSKKNEKIPYYIWLIGDTKQLLKLQQKTKYPTFNNSTTKNIFSVMSCVKNINYAIELNSGKFKLDRDNPKTTISEWEKETRGLSQDTAKLSVVANFSGFLLDDSYLMNPNHYEYDKNIRLTIRKSHINKFGFTHSLNLSSAFIKKGTITIKLKKQIPQWINCFNENTFSTKSVKTYGLKYQIQGIYNAFTEQNYYTEIIIKII